MKKTFKILIIFFLLIVSIIIYLSLIGIETTSFNKKISNQIHKINPKIKIELKKVKFLFNPTSFKIDIKTLGSNIKTKDEILELESIKTSILIKSFVNKDFLINNLEISTKSLRLKDMVKFARSVEDNPKLFLLEKIIRNGYLIADLKLEFNENGEIKKNFNIKGILKEAKFDILNQYNLEKLDLIFDIKDNYYELSNINFNFNEIEFKSKEIKIEDKKKFYFFKGDLNNLKTKILNENKLIKLINKEFKDYKIKEILFSSVNNFSFNLDKKFKFKKIFLNSKVNLVNLVLENNVDLKYFFPELKKIVKFDNNNLDIKYLKNELKINGSGDILIQNFKDKIKYKLIKKNDGTNFDLNYDLKKNPFKINFFEYEKKNENIAKIKIQGKIDKNENIYFNKISFRENNNVLVFKNLILDENKKIKKIDSIKVNLINKNLVKNNFKLRQDKKVYTLEGSSFDTSKMLNNILNSKDEIKLKNILSEKNLKIRIDLQKVYLDKKNFLNDLITKIDINNYEITNIDLNSFFEDGQNFTFTIKKKDDLKVTTLFSSRAKPLVKNYKFIKGFEGGSLDFNSINNGNETKSTIRIYDFKLQQLPVLTKLLTLASLQGIADLLSGEGIRFNEFEMNFSTTKNLIKIEEIYAIGPAISVLMEGYVEKNKLISLRGTLVPATTLNKTIGSIPFIGDILVGKKTGEGVFGVSFKIKGPPGKLQTTVNPIKTLTPRFITRTLEKIKKEK